MGHLDVHRLDDGAFSRDGLFARYAPVLRSLPERVRYGRAELQIPSLKLFDDGVVSCYYAPFDHVNEAARVVLIGVTPGLTQMELAVRTARQHLHRGTPVEGTLRDVKAAARFAGTMRANLVRMLDGVGLARALGVASTSALFGEHRQLLHSTSALRYPVFDRDGANLSRVCAHAFRTPAAPSNAPSAAPERVAPRGARPARSARLLRGRDPPRVRRGA